MTVNDLLVLDALDGAQIVQFAQRAVELADLWRDRRMPQSLAGKRIGLIADLPGWRNPTALALGAREMGASCVTLTASLNGAETIEDLAGYLDNWFDCVAVRAPKLESLRRFATALHAPVLNLRTNDNHPCETLGDLSFVLSRRKTLDGLKVCVVAPDGNILRSWIEASQVLPIEVIQISHPDLFASVGEKGCAKGEFSTSHSLDAAHDADVVVTDCWPKECTQDILTGLAALRISADFLNRCRADLHFIPCPPVTRGQEVGADAMEHHACVARSAKAFLLHAQNAFLELSVGS